jgi:chromosome transmission fidelity protein 4
MATTTQHRVRGRPAHTAGPTYLAYTPDGTKLVTVGSNNTTRVYKTGFDGEPTNIDECPEQNMGVAATVSDPEPFWITGMLIEKPERLLYQWIRRWHCQRILPFRHVF